MAGERLNKVAEAIKEEVAQILQRELKDPRVGFVTVTRVAVTPDLEHATVYFSLLEGHGDAAETEAGLKSAAGFVRRLLGERLRIRVTPEVTFRADPSVAESIRISKLLGQARGEGGETA
ncbi:MAG: 30S ribosome-binding factor RbfA [Candidatus Omnitrophica bacterium]|nr:30S ribosome-binding factor RbfA [Candidatus Omnitrophota bacterium]